MDNLSKLELSQQYKKPTGHIEQEPPLTLADLKNILREHQDNIETTFLGSDSEKIYRDQSMIQGLLEALFSKKERFQQVFTTQNGSIYFVLHSGECLRIRKGKLDDSNGKYEIQPIMKKIFFVPPEDWDRLQLIIEQGRKIEKIDEAFIARKKIYEEMGKEEISDVEYSQVELEIRKGIQRLTGEPIPTTNIRPGVTPLDFDAINSETETIFDLDGSHLILKGRRTKTAGGGEYIGPDGPGIVHHGLPVLEVIKN